MLWCKRVGYVVSPDLPVRNGRPKPMQLLIEANAVALVLSETGNHSTDRRAPDTMVTQAVMPLRKEPTATSLKNNKTII